MKYSPSPRKRKTRVSLQDAVNGVLDPTRLKLEGSNIPLPHQLVIRWRRLLYRLLPLGNASHDNEVTVYSDGTDAFPAMWRAILTAKHSVFLETYTFEPDQIGLRMLNALKVAAKKGVKIVLVYDWVGSLGMWPNTDLVRELEALGATVVAFNPPFNRKRYRGTIFFRNHRKILIVDEKVAFSGGMNISSDYVGAAEGGNGRFRDTHVRVTGPAVQDLIVVFNDSLLEAGRAPVKAADNQSHISSSSATTTPSSPTSSSASSSWRQRQRQRRLDSSPPPSSQAVRGQPTRRQSARNHRIMVPSNDPGHRNVFVQVLRSNVYRERKLIQRANRITIDAARKQIYITNPYFLPPSRIKMALKRAAQRGVDVRVLMCGPLNDVKMAKWAYLYLRSYFLTHGIRIYELQDQILHAKTITADGMYGSVGSFNMDNLSNRRNLEVQLTFLDPDVAKELESHFFDDLERSIEVTMDDDAKRGVFERALHYVAYLLHRFMKFYFILNRERRFFTPFKRKKEKKN
jgi:cardiolipin synthase